MLCCLMVLRAELQVPVDGHKKGKRVAVVCRLALLRAYLKGASFMIRL